MRATGGLRTMAPMDIVLPLLAGGLGLLGVLILVLGVVVTAGEDLRG